MNNDPFGGVNIMINVAGGQSSADKSQCSGNHHGRSSWQGHEHRNPSGRCGSHDHETGDCHSDGSGDQGINIMINVMGENDNHYDPGWGGPYEGHTYYRGRGGNRGPIRGDRARSNFGGKRWEYSGENSDESSSYESEENSDESDSYESGENENHGGGNCGCQGGQHEGEGHGCGQCGNSNEGVNIMINVVGGHGLESHCHNGFGRPCGGCSENGKPPGSDGSQSTEDQSPEYIEG